MTSEAIAPTLAEAADASAILGLLNDVRNWLLARGNRQWDVAMSAAWVESEVSAGHFWLVRDGAGLAAVVRLLDADGGWTDRDRADACYVHTLAVRRDRAGEGLGAAVLAWAAAQATARGRDRLRLDFVTPNPRLEAYYTGLGFVIVGDAELGGAPVRLMERAIDASDGPAQGGW